MDIATVIGLVLGFAVILAAIVMGSGPLVFLHVPSMCIVVGGCSAR